MFVQNRLAHTRQRWQRIVHNFKTVIEQSNFDRLQQPGRWFLAGLGYMLLVAWNERLILSLTAGLIGMVAAFQIQQGQWRLPSLNWQQFFDVQRHPLRMALIAGGAVMLTTYVALSIGLESGQTWISMGWLLQSGLIGILLLTMVQAANGSNLLGNALLSAADESAQVDQLLSQLRHTDPLQRLIAVRRLLQLADQLPIDQEYAPSVPLRSHIRDCFQIVRQQETDPIVQQALASGLAVLQPKAQPQLQAALDQPVTEQAAAEPLVALVHPTKRTVPFDAEQIQQDY